MLTLKQCKELLAEEANELTDQEIIEMRNWLSEFAEIIMDCEASELLENYSKNKNKK
jgi:hypothetical protein